MDRGPITQEAPGRARFDRAVPTHVAGLEVDHDRKNDSIADTEEVRVCRTRFAGSQADQRVAQP